MPLLERFNLLVDLALALKAALFPTVKRILHEPSLLVRPTALSRVFMSYVWIVFGPAIDGSNAEVKTRLLTAHAFGVVLDIGAGHGHTVKYLDRAKITKYVALEPNVHMHSEIRLAANAGGYNEVDDTLVILSCGAEDTTSILATLGGYQPVDTIVSVLTLCSIPEPQQTINALATDVLKPGGELLFFEHVRNDLSHIERWQRFWTPLWSKAFDGCRLDRPSHVWVREVGGWAHEEVWGVDGESEESLFLHRCGRFVKRTQGGLNIP